jgi:hypothetical protein
MPRDKPGDSIRKASLYKKGEDNGTKWEGMGLVGVYCERGRVGMLKAKNRAKTKCL